MPTLKQYVRAAIERGGEEAGVVLVPSSLTTTTVVSAALIGTSASAQKYVGQYVIRRDAASAPADRQRRVTAFTDSTGTLTHAGTNYADTTTTSEQFEVTPYTANTWDIAVQNALNKTKGRFRYEFPSYKGSDYWLSDLSWVSGPSDVTYVRRANRAQLNRNASFERWWGYDTGGLLVPDGWTLAGSGGTMVRATTNARIGPYCAEITRVGADVTLTATIGLLPNGSATTGEDLRGRTVYAAVAGTADAASQVRVRITDGVVTTNSSYLTNAAYSQVATAAHVISSTATTLTVQVRVETTNGSPEIDWCRLWVVDALDDTHYKDQYGEEDVPYRFDQSNGYPRLTLEDVGFGSQYIVVTRRPYPKFDATRLAAGTADADISDAPLDLIAIGTLAELYWGQAQKSTQKDAEKFTQLAGYWKDAFAKLQLTHLETKSDPRGGTPFPMARTFAMPAVRFGGRR